MSGAITDRRQQANPGHAHGTQVKKLPLMMAAGMVLFAFAMVVFATQTGIGVVHTGAGTIDTVGHVAIGREADGAIVVVDRATDAVIGTYRTGPDQFLAGAMRSLDRMRAAAGQEGNRTYAVLRIGSGSVFLEDVQTGDRISLNAFNRAEALALAGRVEALNGGRK